MRLSKSDKAIMDETFQVYSKYKPTGFDSAGVGGKSNGIESFYVMPVSRNRDSGILEESNFTCFLRELKGESSFIQVHRFGHWACGWLELILISPGAVKTLQNAYEMIGALENYPVLDEHDHSEREWKAAHDSWSNMSLQDRIDECKRASVSIFAARHDDRIPEAIDLYILAEES